MQPMLILMAFEDEFAHKGGGKRNDEANKEHDLPLV